MNWNWKKIHPDFNKSWGEYLKAKWENSNFDYLQTQFWIKNGLAPRKDYNFAWWLVNIKRIVVWDSNLNLENLRWEWKKLEENWKRIHSDFLADEAIEWLKREFKYWEVEEWISKGLTPQESAFASYLKKNNENDCITNLEALRKSYHNVTNWLLENYPMQLRSKLKKLNISGKRLEGEFNLKAEGFDNLEELYCSDNKLTSLNCDGCSQLKIIRCQKNSLTFLNLINCPNVNELYCNRNQLISLDFLQDLIPEKLEILLLANNNFPESDLTIFQTFVNLRNLGLGNWHQKEIEQGIYNRFLGSLEPLQHLNKLAELDIAGTDIDNGLEYLSSNIEIFYCYNNERPGAKVEEVIVNSLRNYGVPNQDDDGDEDFAANLRNLKEFHNSPAQKWLENWLESKYPPIKREEETQLYISKQKLKGALELKEFTSLEKLWCSHNELTKLNLSNCQNLKEIYCNDNKLKSLDFLQTLTEKAIGKLEILNISNCPIKGNLMLLEKLTGLKELHISNTNIREGLEYIPANCAKIYCESDYGYKSLEIVRELEKYGNCAKWENNSKYYDLDKWRKLKQDNATSLVLPLERLFLIKNNIKSFIDKWSEKNHKEIVKIGKLQSPAELAHQRWFIYTVQFIGRGAAITGASFLFRDYQAIGGGIIGIYPIAELIASKLEQNLKAKEKEWEQFLADVQKFLNNYYELQGIFKVIKQPNKQGRINEALDSLKSKTEEFLSKYDRDGNETIDLIELIEKKDIFVADLNKNKNSLEEIVLAIKNLEEKVMKYRQDTLYEEVIQVVADNQYTQFQNVY